MHKTSNGILEERYHSILSGKVDGKSYRAVLLIEIFSKNEGDNNAGNGQRVNSDIQSWTLGSWTIKRTTVFWHSEALRFEHRFAPPPCSTDLCIRQIVRMISTIKDGQLTK